MIKDVRQLGARFANSGKPKPQPQVDAEVIRELSDLLTETGLTEIEIEQGGRRVRVARQNSPHISAAPVAVPALSEPVAAPPAVAAEAPAPKRDVDGAVTSPMVGTVLSRPSRESRPS